MGIDNLLILLIKFLELNYVSIKIAYIKGRWIHEFGKCLEKIREW